MFPEHRFYGCVHKQEHWIFNIVEFPDNFTIVTPDQFGHLPAHILFDFAICNERIEQYRHYMSVCFNLHLPLLQIEHDAPPINIRKEDLAIWNNEKRPTKRIATHKNIPDMWQWEFDEIIDYPIDSNSVEEKDRQQNKILILGDCDKSNYAKLQQVIAETSSVFEMIGISPGLSDPPKDIDEITSAFKTSNIYLCLPFPHIGLHYLHLALSYGCKVIGYKNNLVESIIKDGKYGVYCDKFEDIVTTIIHLKDSPIQYAKYDNQETKIKLNTIFTQVAQTIYKP
jgi:hypothetical protein